ncbi:response regulator transcription factor [Salinarimonas rosea]|uniref:response regulator transcription factor n=1 Tax=Salinarimonas rosea TaxID=552063 RepID=UPI000422CCED|nr:response regulator [Salinarimonas rosea]
MPPTVIPAGSRPLAGAPGLVILVDDDAAVRRALTFSLELEGLTVLAHEGGASLLAAPPTGAACLVVDYYMPGMDGVTLVERLREACRELPTILITAKADPDMRARAAAAGIALVLEKPLEDAALVDGIRAALAAAEALRARP